MNEKITAAILCGGQGTRLRPIIGDDLPKCLAPVGGKPFLSYLLNQLSGQGVGRVVLCVRKDQYKEFEKRLPWDYDGLIVDYAYEEELLGTGGALKNALHLLDSDPFLVLNGDTISRFSLDVLLMFHKQWDCDVTMACLGQTSVGIYLLSQKFLVSLPEGPSSLEQQINKWPFGKVRQFYSLESFLDIGTPESYKNAEVWLAARGMI